MNGIQRFFKAVVPRTWGDDMEAHSKAWKLRCACGNVRSYWETGGIRWRAVGKPRIWLRCPACGGRHWHQASYEPQPKAS